MKVRNFFLFAVLLCSLPSAWGSDRLGRLRGEADRLHAEGKNDSAMIVAERALAVAHDENDTTAVVGLHSSMGVFLRTMGRLDDALKHYNTAMKICTSESFRRNAGEEARQEAAVLYLNLATLHVDMQHKEDAAYYARLAAEWCLKCDDKELKAQLLAQDGLIFLMCGDSKEAARLLTMGYDYAMQLKQYSSALSAGAYMMAVSDHIGDGEAVEEWRRRCGRLEGKVDDTMTLVAYYQIQCKLALDHKDWHGALSLFEKILSVKGVSGMPFVVYDCYNNMHEAWAELGEWRKAYDCLGKAVALKDSLFEKDKAESLRDLTVKYQSKEKELALAQSEAELSRTRMYISLIALSVLVCAVLVSLYVQSQRRKIRKREAEFARLKADTDRKLTRRYLEGLESERKRLARELHDGVCNSLYTVQLMADKMLSAGEGVPASAVQIAGSLNGIREQVRRVSHELMPPEFKYADIDIVIGDYVASAAEASGRNIEYVSSPDDADWTSLPDVVSLELYRIAQEAVANAVRHSGAVDVIVTLEMSQGVVTLTVKDNGTREERGRNGGIGLRTMRQRAEAAGGRLDAVSDGGYTGIAVSVKIEK